MRGFIKYKMLFNKLVLIFTFLTTFCQVLALEIKVNVVEFHPEIKDTVDETITFNIDGYRRFLEKSDKGDLAVFPEYGLTGFQRDPEEWSTIIPDKNDPKETYDGISPIRKLSNMAAEFSTYLVVNLLEKDKTSNSTFYNTNVVFDKTGKIIEKYRKINLLDEPRLTAGVEVGFFEIGGERIGLLTSNDLLNYHPSRSMLERNPTITTVVCPSRWINSKPFLVASSFYSGYSINNGVNLIVAGYNDPIVSGNTGSGIFTDHNSTSFISGIVGSKNIFRSVNLNGFSSCLLKKSNSFNTQGFSIIDGGTSNKVEDIKINRQVLSSAKFQNINLGQKDIQSEVTNGKLNCQFHIIISNANNSETYKFMAYKGPINYNGTVKNVEICSLVSCPNGDNTECSYPSISLSTKFYIKIRANFKKSAKSFAQPIGFDFELQPLVGITFCSHNSVIEMATSDPLENVALFGIYIETSGAELLRITVGLIALCLGLLKMYN